MSPAFSPVKGPVEPDNPKNPLILGSRKKKISKNKNHKKKHTKKKKKKPKSSQ